MFMMETSSLRVQVFFTSIAFLFLGVWAGALSLSETPDTFGFYLAALYSSACFTTALVFIFASFPSAYATGRVSMLVALLSCSVLIGLNVAAFILGSWEMLGLLVMNMVFSCYGSFLVYHLKSYDTAGVKVLN